MIGAHFEPSPSDRFGEVFVDYGNNATGVSFNNFTRVLNCTGVNLTPCHVSHEESN